MVGHFPAIVMLGTSGGVIEVDESKYPSLTNLANEAKATLKMSLPFKKADSRAMLGFWGRVYMQK